MNRSNPSPRSTLSHLANHLFSHLPATLALLTLTIVMSQEGYHALTLLSLCVQIYHGYMMNGPWYRQFNAECDAWEAEQVMIREQDLREAAEELERDRLHREFMDAF
jgi:hypothetical protein